MNFPVINHEEPTENILKFDELIFHSYTPQQSHPITMEIMLRLSSPSYSSCGKTATHNLFEMDLSHI